MIDNKITTDLSHDKDNDKDNDERDKSIFSILGANPQPDPPELQQVKLARKRKLTLMEAIPEAWEMYKGTWEGFFDNHKKGFSDKNKDSEEDNVNDESFIDEEKITKKQKELRKNIKGNVKALKKEGANALEAAKDVTGIRNKKDLVEWSMKQLKLANECLGEFMMGYRRARDEEIDKVMNEYFKDFDVEGDEKEKNELNKVDGISRSSEIKAGRRKRKRKSKW